MARSDAQDPAEAIADELYGIDPDEFVAQRDARAQQARQDGDRELAAAVRALRRPTAAAWAVNLLARAESDELAGLLGLGDELRVAQRELHGEELRRLNTQRRQVVAALTRLARRAAADAGHPLGSEAVLQVEQTLTAALSDPDAAREVSAGRLTKPLQYAGLGVQSSTSAGSAPPRPRPKPEPAGQPGQSAREREDELARRRRRAELERELTAAREDLVAADADLDRAGDDLEAAHHDVRDMERRREELQRELDRLERSQRDAERTRKEAERGVSKAELARDEAQRRVDRLEERYRETADT